MNIARYYIKGIHDKWGPLKLDKELWVNQPELTRQWLETLRLKNGDQLVLFDDQTERLYQIDKVELPSSVHLKMVTEEERRLPKRHLYLIWALTARPVDEAIIEQATKLGVRNFIPLLNDEAAADADFDLAASRQLIIKAAEDAGWADIPDIREPAGLAEILSEYADLPLLTIVTDGPPPNNPGGKVGLLVGPPGGWSRHEASLINRRRLATITADGNLPPAERLAAIIRRLQR